MDDVGITSHDSMRLVSYATETGYLWHFTTPTVAALGGPVALVLGWLDEESQTADWKKRDQEARQRGNFFSHRM